MPPSLDSALSKIEHAAEHLQHLYGVVAALSEVPMNAVAFERDNETGEAVLVLDDLRAPGQRVAAVIGDCVHNLRSPLDQLAWQLVKIQRSTKGQASARLQIYFPIYANRKLYNALTGIIPRAQAVIEQLQPYHAGNAAGSHPLWLLHQLSKWDKHRLSGAVTYTLTESSISLGREALETVSLRPPGPVESGAELARYRRVVNNKVRVAFEGTFGVAFKDGPADGK